VRRAKAALAVVDRLPTLLDRGEVPARAATADDPEPALLRIEREPPPDGESSTTSFVPSDSLQNRQVVYMRAGEERVANGEPVSIASQKLRDRLQRYYTPRHGYTPGPVF
jgi:hypothetical protein